MLNRMSDYAHINHTFFHSIYVEQVVYLIVVERSDLAAPQTHCNSSESEVFSNVPGVCHRPRYTAPVMVGWSAPTRVGRSAPPMVARCAPPAVG